jgi:uncharacterized lipoprotein YbaY
MKSLLIMAAVAATASALSGCQDKKPEPVPGPQSALMRRTTNAVRMLVDSRAEKSVLWSRALAPRRLQSLAD